MYVYIYNLSFGLREPVVIMIPHVHISALLISNNHTIDNTP